MQKFLVSKKENKTWYHGIMEFASNRIVKSNMMDGLKPLQHLQLMVNVDSDWHHFKQQFLLYPEAMGLNLKPGARKVDLLLTIAGLQVSKIYIFIKWMIV